MNGLFAGVDVCAHGRDVQEGLDSQSPPECFLPYCEIETLRCRMQPSATPWQPEPRIGNDHGNVLTGVASLHNNSH